MEHCPLTVSAFSASGFKTLLVNLIGTIQSQHEKRSSPLTDRVNRRGIRKTNAKEKSGGESERPRHVLGCNKNRPTRHDGAMMGDLLRPSAPFFPSLILNFYTDLRPLRMSRAHIFPNAHGTAVSGGTFYAANAVSETVRYVLSKLIAWISDRSISTTAIGRRPMGSFP